MNETSHSSRKRLKVLAKQNQLPLLIESPKIPHLTGVITVSASGKFFKPLIVLPNKKTLRTLKDFEDRCYFCSTSSGLMTKKTFLYYSLLLFSQISRYGLSLDEKIRRSFFLLILDGASSHISFLSAYLFYLFSVDLLLIPPHSSHLLSAFDVALASPLKSYFSQMLNQLNYTSDLSLRKNLTFLRTNVIEIFLSSSAKACNPININSGFTQSGICPLNPELPLSTDFAMTTQNIFKNKSQNNLPTYFLNSEAGLEHLFQSENDRELTQKDLNDTYKNIIDQLSNCTDLSSGIPLSKISEILIDKGETIEKHKIPIP